MSLVIENCKQQALSDLKRLAENILNQLEWSDMHLLRALLVFIDTQSWMKKDLSGESSEPSSNEFNDVSLVEVRRAVK